MVGLKPEPHHIPIGHGPLPDVEMEDEIAGWDLGADWVPPTLRFTESHLSAHPDSTRESHLSVEDNVQAM